MHDTNSSQLPPAGIFSWMSSLVRERLHKDLIVSATPCCTELLLSLPGNDTRIRIRSNLKAFKSNRVESTCLHWNPATEGWPSVTEGPLPAPGLAPLNTPLIERSTDGYMVHYDVLGLSYWMLSRREELQSAALDAHGRFPATSSHAYRNGYLERPIVDEWLHILGQVARRLWPGLSLNTHQFSIRVSHDVDWPSRYGFGTAGQMLRLAAADALKRHDLRALLAPLIWQRSHTRLHPADPFNTFDWLMDQSERHGLQSAFYFLCGRTDPARDAWYEPEAPAIRALMRRIHERGHEIGLHASYGTYRNPAMLAQEARRLKRICTEEGIHQERWGGRMHYLRWETPTTLHGWANAGMDYDSSLSYADAAGFRCGTCFSYPAFDALADQSLPLRIQPLIAMEKSVIGAAYGNLEAGAPALEKFIRLKNACAAVHGCFTLLWHNSELDDPYRRALYTDILTSADAGPDIALTHLQPGFTP